MSTPAPYPKCDKHGTLMKKGSYLNGLKYNRVMYSTHYYCYDCLDETLQQKEEKPMIKNISEIVDSEAVMKAAFEHPTMEIKPRKLPPTIDTALKCVVNAIEDAVIETVAAEVEAKLADRWEQFVLLRGDHADQNATPATPDGESERDEYESDADALVEEICIPYQELLSQNWLGKNTIDTALWLEDAVKKFSLKLGQEYYNNLVHQRGNAKGEGSGRKTPNQIMSSAGITQTDVQARLDQLLSNYQQPTEKETETMASTSTGIDAVLEQVFAHVGKDYDRLEVLGDLDLASDDDDNLSHGALPRIGLDAGALEILREQRMYHGSKTADILEGKLYDIATAKPAKKGAKPAAKKEAAPKAEKQSPVAKEKTKRKKDEAEHENPTSAVPAEVLETLKSCGGQDKELAEKLGVSRVTYNGYANGKTEFVADEKQRGILRNELVNKLNALGEALKAFDGTEVEFVV